MKAFKTPRMTLCRLETEELMRSSTCFEIFACVDCYCTKVVCDDVYVCDGLNCPTLSDYD